MENIDMANPHDDPKSITASNGHKFIGPLTEVGLQETKYYQDLAEKPVIQADGTKAPETSQRKVFDQNFLKDGKFKSDDKFDERRIVLEFDQKGKPVAAYSGVLRMDEVSNEAIPVLLIDQKLDLRAITNDPGAIKEITDIPVALRPKGMALDRASADIIVEQDVLKSVEVREVMGARKGGSFHAKTAEIDGVKIRQDIRNERLEITVDGKRIAIPDDPKSGVMTIGGQTIDNPALKKEISDAAKGALKDGRFTSQEASDVGNLAKKVVAAVAPEPKAEGRSGPK